MMATLSGSRPSPVCTQGMEDQDVTGRTSLNTLMSFEVLQRTSPLRLRNRISPDRERIPRLNLSPAILEKNKAWLGTPEKSVSTRMRRTASLDAIFLRGSSKETEPRVALLLSKATQTPEEWDSCSLADLATADCTSCTAGVSSSTNGNSLNSGSSNSSSANSSRRPSSSVCTSPWPTGGVPPSVSENIEKFIRHRLQRNNKEAVGTSGSRHSPVQGDHSVLVKPYAFVQKSYSPCEIGGAVRSASVPQIPRPLLPRFRSSVEELNQEIERLVLRPHSQHGSEDEDEWCISHQDGRRAPISEYFRSRRSVNTQTPARHSNRSTPCSSPTFSPPPVYITTPPDSPFGRAGTPHRLQSSPHINKFITKEPPDGCERVALKHSEDSDSTRTACWATTTKPAAVFTLLPSLGSAFCAPGRSSGLSRGIDGVPNKFHSEDKTKISLVGFDGPQRSCDDSGQGVPLTVGKQ